MGSITSEYLYPVLSVEEIPISNVIGPLVLNNKDYVTIFREAVLQSNLSLISKCIHIGVDVNTEIENGNVALHIAADKCDLLMMKLLLQAPYIKIDTKNNSGLTSLMNGCITNCREVVQILLKYKANPNLKTLDGNTALHFACYRQNMGVVFDLVQNGAFTNVRNVFDVTPLAIAVIDFPSMPIAKFIMQKGGKKHGFKKFPLLLECVLCCNNLKRLQIFKVLVAKGMDIHQLHPLEHRNCLHYVAISAYLPLVNYLLTFNMDKDLRILDASCRTPMDIALSHQNFAVFELFKYYTLWRMQMLEITKMESKESTLLTI